MVKLTPPPYLEEGGLSHSCLDKLIGRLSFSQTAIFGKFDRTQLRPLYTKMYRRVYNVRLSKLERATLRWRREVIAEFPPRLAVHRPARADWRIYTDASSEPPTICALIFRGNSPQQDLAPAILIACPWSGTTLVGIPRLFMAWDSFPLWPVSTHMPPVFGASSADGFTWEITISPHLSPAGIQIRIQSMSWSHVFGRQFSDSTSAFGSPWPDRC